MKKLPFKKKSDAKRTIPSRITNETVAEHRERILAGGRRFKYPMQYARHRLVLNAIILSVVTLVVLVALGWYLLYQAQTTNSFMYRVTRIIPAPVASVDGQLVRYSDYLMYYNSSAHYLQQSEQLNLSSDEGKQQVAYIKRKTLDKAIRDGYVDKVASELGVTASDEQLKNANEEHLTTVNGKISRETYNASTLNLLGWSPEEEQLVTKRQILKDNVAYKIDNVAKEKSEKAATLVRAKKADFSKIAKELGGEGSAKVTAGVSGLVPLTNRDGGLATAAGALEKGEISEVIRATTGDGYYFVKLLERNDTQLSYAYLRIPLTEFDTRLSALKKSGKVDEYINVPDVQTQQK